jgi:hypothetical protein
MDGKKDNITLEASNVFIKVIHSSGVVEEDTIHNGVVQAGGAEVVKMMSGIGTTSVFNKMQIGSGTTAFSSTQTALVSEIESTTASLSIGTTNYSGDTMISVGTFAISTTESVTESGVFNSSVMLARSVFAAKSLSKGDTIQFTWRVRV